MSIISQYYESLVRDGRPHVPFHRIEVAAGRFLPDSFDSIDQLVVLPPESEFRHGIRDRYDSGYRLPRRSLAAATVRGDSMRERAIYHGQKIQFQHHDFESVESGRLSVIEMIGEGGAGS